MKQISNSHLRWPKGRRSCVKYISKERINNESTPDFLKTLEEGFKEFFEKEVPANPLKAEYLIPTFIGELLSEGKISVKALRTNDTWYGMTYKEDVAAVKESFSKMLENGTYKGDLFSDL